MLFTCDYTAEDVAQRPYLQSTHGIVLFDADNQPLSRIWTFETDTMMGTLKDGTPVPVHHYGWFCANQDQYQRVLKYLPAEYHHLVQLCDPTLVVATPCHGNA
jgi:hypothetical protein